MSPQKSFNGLSHDIAHHAQSFLSYLHPHLAQACVLAGVSSVQLDLVSNSPYPQDFPISDSLRLATAALQERFRLELNEIGLTYDDIKKAVLEFYFKDGDESSSPKVVSDFELVRGGTFSHTIDFI